MWIPAWKSLGSFHEKLTEPTSNAVTSSIYTSISEILQAEVQVLQIRGQNSQSLSKPSRMRHRKHFLMLKKKSVL